MNADEKAHSLWLEIINRTVTQDMVLSALKEVSAQTLRDVCDELIEKYEGQGVTLTTAVMHIRAKVVEMRKEPPSPVGWPTPMYTSAEVQAAMKWAGLGGLARITVANRLATRKKP